MYALAIHVPCDDQPLYFRCSFTDLEQALVAHYQRPVQLKIANEGPLAKETPALRRTREQEARQQQAVASIENDANVKAITDAFGGAVSTDSIRPRET